VGCARLARGDPGPFPAADRPFLHSRWVPPRSARPAVRLATEMMRFDLVTHRRAPLPAPRRASRAGARAAGAPSGASLSRAPPWAVGATPVSGCPVETDRAVEDDEGSLNVASASPSSAKE
jgi:hypothetical protein